MEKVSIEIPSSLMQQWEQEALAQKVPYTEFSTFLRMKQDNYLQSLESSRNMERQPIFANAARNKLTEYGNSFVLEHFRQMDVKERVCKFAKFDLDDLMNKLSRGFETEAQKEDFIFERDHWFARLKDRMKEFRLSKETLASFGLDWKECKTFAYQTI